MSIRRVVPVEEAEWRLEPPPPWVEAREPDWRFTPQGGEGAAYLLLDQQHDVATQAVSFRNVRRLLTHAAVQALGQVEIEFDPAAHRLLLHELAVWREGEGGAWERHASARREDFLLRQREQQLEQQMLNGRLSLVALLEDVRVGDVIDLAWTLEPLQPLPGLRFTTFFAFAWAVPVARASLSLHLDPATPVKWRMHAPADVTPPAETSLRGCVTWTSERPEVAEPEPNAPGSDWPCAVLDVSGWSSWEEVARFFASLWADALADGADAIASEAERLRREAPGEPIVRKAIRLVQEEVRYLAADFGHGAGMLPNGAGTVLRRRFGDCKDKSVLLAALLRALGFADACPLLVAPSWRAALDRVQPSTNAFSHAIVTLTAEGRRLFVDPTFVGQGGDLAHLVPPPYLRGLEVRDGATELVVLPAPPAAEFRLTETFDLDKKSGNGSVEQVFHARGPMADDIRAVVVRSGRSGFAKASAEVLQTHFPALVPGDEPIDVRDDLERNEIEVRLRHRLPTWGPVGQNAPEGFVYGAHGLFYAVESIEGPEQRRQPWSQRHPLLAHHRVVIRGDCVRAPQAERHFTSGPGFDYSCEVTPARKEARFDYHWVSTRPEIPAEDWPAFCQERTRALEEAGGARVSTASRPSWAWPALAAFIVALAIAGALREGGSNRVPTPEQRWVQIEQSMRDASQAMEREDFATAAELLDRLEPYYAKSFGYHSMRAETSLRTGRLELARASIAAAREIDPSRSETDLQEARLHELAGDLPAARKSAEDLLFRDPDNGRALLLLARVTQQLGDTWVARIAWERVLSLYPGHADALVNYAFLLWREGEREQADAAIRQVVEAQPTASPALELALSVYLDATGRPEEAVEPARRAAERAPGEPRFARQYVTTLLRAGRETEALEVAREMGERFPGHPLALGALALASAKTGDEDVAEGAFQAWLRAAPGDAGVVANYGYFLQQTGRLEESRARLEQATRDFPGSGFVWLNYAKVLSALGEVEAAASARSRAESLIPARQRAALLE